MGELIRYLTDNPDLTNAIATVASALIAMGALLVSGVSLVLGMRALSLQHRHNVLCVKPLASLSYADYEERLTVKIYNNGSGPMVIRQLTVRDSTTAKDNVIDWMPDLPAGMYWDTFTKELAGKSLSPSREIVLLQLVGDMTQAEFRKARDACRDSLSRLTIEIEYLDIYDSPMPRVTRSLSWFGRKKAAEATG